MEETIEKIKADAEAAGHELFNVTMDEPTLGFAGVLYETYCHGVGGVAFNNDPLPSWDDFKNDPAKAKQVYGWYLVAETALKA